MQPRIAGVLTPCSKFWTTEMETGRRQTDIFPCFPPSDRLCREAMLSKPIWICPICLAASSDSFKPCLGAVVHTVRNHLGLFPSFPASLLSSLFPSWDCTLQIKHQHSNSGCVFQGTQTSSFCILSMSNIFWCLGYPSSVFTYCSWRIFSETLQSVMHGIHLTKVKSWHYHRGKALAVMLLPDGHLGLYILISCQLTYFLLCTWFTQVQKF